MSFLRRMWRRVRFALGSACHGIGDPVGSAWQSTTPPTSGTEVVTVGDVSELPGKVRTIGKVSDTGAVEY
jgi:hypothetical protein